MEEIISGVADKVEEMDTSIKKNVKSTNNAASRKSKTV